ncbi:H/ACA ribonucleoprotein complex subunit 2-like protein [Leptotrombidium deliense]|uniref:H/ACA ribonucleoprotein complex subunit 2-like protein n=1 Tax=Leptotrombidium deliense TaxID=299467 RepID=A0A443SAW7_9ACAR|nr:H/ACA ribonucleoprotein complex subunit 2-like protein [Leptotrombidium deliense]
MGKSKKEKRALEEEDNDQCEAKKLKVEEQPEESEAAVTSGYGLVNLSYSDKMRYISVIAKPMASKKLAKKLFKLIKKASKKKTYLRSGLKDVQTRIRKGENGLVVFAGDVTPIDVMSHLPICCEERELPYVYVPLRYDISTAMGVKRPCLMVLIRDHEDYTELYKECENEMKSLPIPN